MPVPKRNDRVIINVINQIRRSYLPATTLSDVSALRSAMSLVSGMIIQMEITQGHRKVIREWRRFCDEFESARKPRTPGATFKWVDESIEAQLSRK